ncbi:hypothetical protein D3C72_2573940 [compost metagenome]
MRRTFLGVLITTSPPEFMVFRSSVAISGFRATMCSTRFSGRINVVLGPATAGFSSDG